MSRRAWNALATVSIVVGFFLGLQPLVQWFATGRRNGLIERIFGPQLEPWVWGIPALILVVAVAGVFFFGTRGDRARR